MRPGFNLELQAAPHSLLTLLLFLLRKDLHQCLAHSQLQQALRVFDTSRYAGQRTGMRPLPQACDL